MHNLKKAKEIGVREEKQCPLLEKIYIPFILRGFFSCVILSSQEGMSSVRDAVEACKMRQIKISGWFCTVKPHMADEKLIHR